MFQDEGRFGLLGTPQRCWAPHGTRPVVGARLERKYIYAFSAVSPHDGVMDSLVLPWVNAETMSLFLAEVAQPQDVALVAEKILATLAEPIDLVGHSLTVTTSIGIAIYPVNGTDDSQELMKKADAAMYQAKEAGRNGYRFFDG